MGPLTLPWPPWFCMAPTADQNILCLGVSLSSASYEYTLSPSPAQSQDGTPAWGKAREMPWERERI